MALNDRFTEYSSEDATARNYREELPKERQSSLANRRLVEELANRACVMEALREKKSIQGRFGRKQEAVIGTGRSPLNFMGRQNKLPVHDRLGHIRRRGHNLTVHDRLGYVRRNRNLSVHDRLGYDGRWGRRSFKSGISPLNRDEFDFQKSRFENKRQTEFCRRDDFQANREFGRRDDFEANCEFGRRDDFQENREFSRRGDFQANRRSSGGNIYVRVHSDRFQHKADIDDMRLEVANRADPAGIFYYHNGIRYYKSEIFVWITEWQPLD